MTDLWTTPARLLRVGDEIQACDWSGRHWRGGPPLRIVSLGKTRDKWISIVVTGGISTNPTDIRELQIQPDDPVTLVSRDVPKSRQVSKPRAERLEAPSAIPTKIKQPRKGQLKLF